MKHKPNSIDIQAIRTKRLLWIRSKYGLLTPTNVLQDARTPSSPLHRFGGYQWNVHKAALRHWLDHSARLIADVDEIIKYVDSRPITIPKFYPDPTVPKRQQGMVDRVDINQLRNDKNKAQLMIEDQLRGVIGYLRRVRAVAEELGLLAMVDRIIAEVMNCDEAIHREIRRRAHRRETKRTTRTKTRPTGRHARRKGDE